MKKSDALVALSRSLDEAEAINPKDMDDVALLSWRANCRSALARISPDAAERFDQIDFVPNVVLDVNDPEGTRQKVSAACEKGLKIANALLRSAIEEVERQPYSPADPQRENNEIVRIVLLAMHDLYLKYGGKRNWTIKASSFRREGVTEKEAGLALNRLRDRGFVSLVAMGGQYKLEPAGVNAAEEARVSMAVPHSGIDRAPGSLMSPADFSSVALIETLIENKDILEIVRRDVAELQSAVHFGLAKSTLLLGGSVLEALLVDVLDRNRAVASSYLKKKRFPEEASLPDLISIAGAPELLEAPRHLLTPTAVALAKAVTDHRDLIHPHAEARGRIRVDSATAKAIVHLIGLVVRDLVDAKRRGDIDAYAER